MKVKIVSALCCLLVMCGYVAAAENVPQSKEEITRAAMRANKKALVAQNMNLTPDQESIFWPMYDQYQIEINKLNADREAAVKKFAINYESMTDEMAKELMDMVLDLDKRRSDLKKSLVSTFSKKFPSKIVARYFQIENKVDAAIMAEAAGQIPLLK